MIDDQEEKKSIQLKKYQDPATNTERQSYNVLLAQFGECLISGHLIDIAKNLFTDDCKFFLFNSTGRTSVQYCLQPKDLPNLYKGMRVQERIVRETYIDLEKGTAIQMSNFKILYEDEDDLSDEIAAEIFTITSDRISKYRCFIGKMTPAHGIEDPFEISRKEKILRKVKQINSAFTGQPDLEKVAALLHETVKYKIWSWDSQKFFTFGKHDIAARFRTELEETFAIKSIVPYEVFTEGKFVFGTYAVHLEGKSPENIGKKFVWLSTCVYSFDQDLNIIKINQQGELGLESEVKIPFGVYPREKLIEKVKYITHEVKLCADVFYSDLVDFNQVTYIFGPHGLPTVGRFHGVEKLELIVTQWQKGHTSTGPSQCVDLYVDINHEGYDTVIRVTCFEGVLDYPNYKYSGMELNGISVNVFSLTNGKLVKTLCIFSEIPEPIVSPFDDPSFESINIKCNQKLI